MRKWMWCCAALVVLGVAGAFWLVRFGLRNQESTVGRTLASLHRIPLGEERDSGPRRGGEAGGEETQEAFLSQARPLPKGEENPGLTQPGETGSVLETIVVEMPEPVPPRLAPARVAAEDAAEERLPLGFENGLGEVQVVAGSPDSEEFPTFPGAVSAQVEPKRNSLFPPSQEVLDRIANATWNTFCAAAMPCWCRPLSKLVVIRTLRVETDKSVRIEVGAHAPYLPPMKPELKKNPPGEEESEFGIDVRKEVPVSPPLIEVSGGNAADGTVRGQGEVMVPEGHEVDPHHNHCPHCPYSGRYAAPYRYRFVERQPEAVPVP